METIKKKFSIAQKKQLMKTYIELLVLEGYDISELLFKSMANFNFESIEKMIEYDEMNCSKLSKLFYNLTEFKG